MVFRRFIAVACGKVRDFGEKTLISVGKKRIKKDLHLAAAARYLYRVLFGWAQQNNC
jgi:hypothetical protein